MEKSVLSVVEKLAGPMSSCSTLAFLQNREVAVLPELKPTCEEVSKFVEIVDLAPSASRLGAFVTTEMARLGTANCPGPEETSLPTQESKSAIGKLSIACFLPEHVSCSLGISHIGSMEASGRKHVAR